MNPLPHNQEAEEAVIGCMMIERDALEVALEKLTHKDFYSPTLSAIFELFAHNHSKGRPIDATTATDMLGKELAHTAIKTMDAVGSVVNVAEYCRIVKDKSRLRSLMASIAQIGVKCEEMDVEVKDVLGEAEKAIFELSKAHATADLEPMSEIMPQIAEKIEKLMAAKNHVTGVSTGFPKLDKYTAGLHPGNLVILAARPSVGKSALMMNLVKNVCIKQKLTTAVFSFEMSKEELSFRLMSDMSGVPLQKIRTGFMDSENTKAVFEAVSKISECPLHIDTSGNSATTFGIRTQVRRLATRCGVEGKPLGLVVVDYLGLMTSSKKADNRTDEVSKISKSLKSLAQEVGVPIVALSQLNRGVEDHSRDGRPRLFDLRDSGAVEQDADVVIFIYREGIHRPPKTEIPPLEYDELMSRAELIIAKQRNGPVGTIKMRFDRKLTRFEENEV